MAPLPAGAGAARVSCLVGSDSIVFQVMTDRSAGALWELAAGDFASLEFIRDATGAVAAGRVDEWVRLGKSLVIVTMLDGQQETSTASGFESLLPNTWWRRMARHTRYRPWRS